MKSQYSRISISFSVQKEKERSTYQVEEVKEEKEIKRQIKR